MTWDPEADELYPQSVLLKPAGTTNSYGRKNASATANDRYPALIEYKTRLVRDKDGHETASSITVYLSGKYGTSGVTPEWTLTFTDGTSRPILSVNRYPDEQGNLHEVVYLQ